MRLHIIISRSCKLSFDCICNIEMQLLKKFFTFIDSSKKIVCWKTPVESIDPHYLANPFYQTRKKNFWHEINIRTNAYHLLNTFMQYFIIYYLPFLSNFIFHNTTYILLYVPFFLPFNIFMWHLFTSQTVLLRRNILFFYMR